MSRHSHKRPFRPGLESLESRALPAHVTLSPLGVIKIRGDEGPDLVSVACTADRVTVSSFAGPGGQHQVSFNRADVVRVVFRGRGGNDNFTNVSTIPARAFGDEGDDILKGGSGRDRLSGGDGDDTLTGAAGDDLLFGDAGQDSLSGGLGDDELYGGSNGFVQVNGQLVLGGDLLDGGNGEDLLVGDFVEDLPDNFVVGDDVSIISGGGVFAFPTGVTVDAVTVGSGQPGDGNVFVFPSGVSVDSVGMASQFAGNDVLLGGQGGDTLFGGFGDDLLDAGSEASSGIVLFGTGAAFGATATQSPVDFLVGGVGTDAFVRPRGSQRVVVVDQEELELVTERPPASAPSGVFLPPFGSTNLPLSMGTGETSGNGVHTVIVC